MELLKCFILKDIGESQEVFKVDEKKSTAFLKSLATPVEVASFRFKNANTDRSSVSNDIMMIVKSCIRYY